MLILPVLDIKDGQVVRGIGGERQHYRPSASKLTASCQPRHVAQAFRERFGLDELYLADLDAISGAQPTWRTYEELHGLGCRLWVDAGIRDLERATLLEWAGIHTIIVGLETVDGPEVLAEICRADAGRRVVFSLDLKGGKPLGRPDAWPTFDARSIAAQAIAAGVGGLIVLDLARVGRGEGVGTDELCSQLATAFPQVQVLAGGGIRQLADLRHLESRGVRGALVGSALHDGRLSPEDVAQC